MKTAPVKIVIERLDNGWVVSIGTSPPFVLQDQESDRTPFIYDSGDGWQLTLAYRK